MTRTIRTITIAFASLLLPLAAIAAPVQYQLRVDGLACPFCAYGIEKELTATAGVERIDIDINGGTVTVTMAEGATFSEAVASRIVQDAGFTLSGFGQIEAQTTASR